MDPRSDLEILAAIAAGQVNAYRFIISRYKNMAYSTAYAILRNREEAEDVVQEAFIRAYKALGKFRGKSKFSTWLFRIIYFTTLTKYQATKYQRVSLPLEEQDFEPHASFNNGLISLQETERTKYLSAAMDQLSPEDKLAITLYYVEEKTHPEIAELTGWNVSATKVRIHRARKKMEQYLNQVLPDTKTSI